MHKDARIFIAGTQTLIGSALLRHLNQQSYTAVSSDPDEENALRSAEAVEALFVRYKPRYVFLAAGKSGGIGANQKYPAEFMLDNLVTATNVISRAYLHGVEKLLYLASSCSYPRLAPHPISEQALLTR